MSTFCTLIIVGVPFVRPMENVTTTAGKNFSIRCYVAGYPVSQVTWSKGELRYIFFTRKVIQCRCQLLLQCRLPVKKMAGNYNLVTNIVPCNVTAVG